tara:strand:+ start:80 stop:832 length:753 start_codon:yes stop_codon:yes gene_type:complete
MPSPGSDGKTVFSSTAALDHWRATALQNRNVTTTNVGTTEALAALQKAFLAGHITAIVYDQARRGLLATNTTNTSSNSCNSSNSSTPVATPMYQGPQPQMMTRQPNRNSGTPLELEMVDGVLSIDYPLPWYAYVFMMPFPFLCMGCCMFNASKIEFDDTTNQAHVKAWNGGCCGHCGLCHRSWVGPYNDIINFKQEVTNMQVNGHFMYTIIMKVRGDDGAPQEYKFGMDYMYTSMEKVKDLNGFVNARRY